MLTLQDYLSFLHLTLPGLSLTALIWLVGAIALALLLVANSRQRKDPAVPTTDHTTEQRQKALTSERTRRP